MTALRECWLRPPRRSDRRVAVLSVALVLVGYLLPRTGRVGGASPLGALKATLVVGGLVLGPLALGYRRRSPVLAWGLLYALLATLGFATGMWQVTVQTGPSGDFALAYMLVVFEAPAYATVLAAACYPVGYAVSLAAARLEWGTA